VKVALLASLLLLVLGVAGLYATGPKYQSYCPNRQTLRHAVPEIGERTITYCQAGGQVLTRQLPAWRRVWYGLVGSKNTSG
jgi:hypothetical protein